MNTIFKWIYLLFFFIALISDMNRKLFHLIIALSPTVLSLVEVFGMAIL